jgi:hypothetical protein
MLKGASLIRQLAVMIGLAAVAPACRSAQLYSRASVRYPAPTDEVCGIPGTSSKLEVLVRDKGGYVLAGVSVYAGEMGATAVFAGLTDQHGTAILEVTGDKAYVLSAGLWGFGPATTALQASAGCTGKAMLMLEVTSDVVVE